MDDNILSKLREHYKIFLMNTDEFKEAVRDIDVKHPYFKIFNRMYDLKHLKNVLKLDQTLYKSVDFHIDYQPFEILYEMSQSKCIDDSNRKHVTYYDHGKEEHQSFDVHTKNYKLLGLQYPQNFHFYKTMDGFYTVDEDQEFMKTHIDTPFWFSSPFFAYQAITKRNGGMTSYKLNKDIHILIINCENILNLIKIVKEYEDDIIKIRSTKYKKSYILDLLRLSACSEKGFIHQVGIYQRLSNYGNEIWLAQQPKEDSGLLCNMPIDSTNYFGLTFYKGKHNFNFAYLLKYINEKYFQNYYSAYIIKFLYTPFFRSGVSLEEIIFFSPHGTLERDTNDPYDWYQYADKLPFKVVPQFRIPRLYSEFNQQFSIFINYDIGFKSEKNNKIKEKFKGHTSVIFHDMHYFKGINTNDTPQVLKQKLLEFMEYMNADIYLLSHTPPIEVKGYQSIVKGLMTIYFKNKITVDSSKILYLHLKDKIEYPYNVPLFHDFIKMIDENYHEHTKQIDQSLQHDPNIIFCSGNVYNQSPEIQYMTNKNYTTKTLKYHVDPKIMMTTFTKFKPIKISKLTYGYGLSFPIAVIY